MFVSFRFLSTSTVSVPVKMIFLTRNKFFHFFFNFHTGRNNARFERVITHDNLYVYCSLFSKQRFYCSRNETQFLLDVATRFPCQLTFNASTWPSQETNRQVSEPVGIIIATGSNLPLNNEATARRDVLFHNELSSVRITFPLAKQRSTFSFTVRIMGSD